MLCDPLTPVVMAATGMKRSFVSNPYCFSNLYLIEFFRKCKSKSYLKSIMMIIGKDLSITKKKLNFFRMKMCKGVRLRRVKVKSFVHKWQMRENTIPTVLSSKHEVWEWMADIANVLYVEGLRVNLLSISQISDKDFMVLFSKGKCLVLNKFGKKLISSVCTLDNYFGLVPGVDIVCNNIRLPNEDLWHQRMGHASYIHLSIVSNSFMSFSRHTRTHAFSSSRPKTRAVWVRKEPKT